MKPISSIPTSDAAAVTVLLCDIDDTLTQTGRLLPESFEALWRLKDSGIRVVPITGRPAGWCDCILRQWPVDAIVGENGAFCWYLDGDAVRELVHPQADKGHRRRLQQLERAVLDRFPKAKVARDQPFRFYDLAVDFREDNDLDLSTADQIARFCRDQGAAAKVSSIHVNAWFGHYDKLEMTKRYLHHVGLSRDDMRKTVCFCGDSPNDEPMFAFFPVSVGVANITETISLLHDVPAYVSSAARGIGFAEIVDTFVMKRADRG